MKEISIKEFQNVKIGNAENKIAGTGCTVFIFDKGASTGLSVRGGGAASRETELLKPLAAAEKINAILLSGGSAFGLDCAGGVMKYLEERNIGFDVGVTKVPLVCQSCLFDLTVSDAFTRPDKEMGYEACVNAEKFNYKDGNFGAGTGATVGKLSGMEHCMKSGIGSYALQIGELKIGAVVAVNSLGDIYDYRNGKKVAGLISDDKKFLSTDEELYKNYSARENKFIENGNTTLAVILTNACFKKSYLCKIADMAHNGYARSIKPVHTTADGDSIYAVSLGNLIADLDIVGTLAAQVVSEAILRAVESAESDYGYMAVKDLER